MILVTTDDYNSGEVILTQDINTTPLLQSYIDKYEKEYILRIYGKELGDIVIDKITTNTSDARVNDIKDAFEKEIYDRLCISKGLKIILQKIIAYHYIISTQYKHSMAGIVGVEKENASKANDLIVANYAESMYNDAVSSIISIQLFCRFNSSVYPEFKGELFRRILTPYL